MSRLVGVLAVLFLLSTQALAFAAQPSHPPYYGFGGPLWSSGVWYWILLLDEGSGVPLDAMSVSRTLERQEPVVKLIESLGGVVVHRHWIINAISFRAPVEVALKLAGMGYTIVPSKLYEPQAFISSLGGGLEPSDRIGVVTIGASRLHELGVTGRGVRVAVLDTGVENGHPWLARGGRSVVEWEVDATGTGIVDYCGKRIGWHWGGAHGTHVAGIIAGQNPATPGVAPGSIIYDIIVFGEELLCWGAWDSDIIRGVELALLGPDGVPGSGDEADVINLSLGSTMPPWLMAAITGVVEWRLSDPLVEALKRAVAMGKFVVVAASNGAGHMTINVLCGAPGVICVGSSDQRGTDSRGDDRLSLFSSRGPMPWFDVAPTLVAPGERIYSTIPTALAEELGLPQPALEASGTSMAAPHVSGSIALLLELYRSQGRHLTPEGAARLLVNSATTIEASEGGHLAGPMEAGAGLLNVYDAAFPDLLVEVDGDYKSSKVAYGDRVDFTVTIANVADRTVRGSIRVWLDDTFRPGREGFEDAVSVDPGRTVEVPPQGRVTVTVSVDASRLAPGLYGGYVDVVAGGRSYRVVVSILVPAKPRVEGFHLRAEVLEVTVGRFSGIFSGSDRWVPDWAMAAFYVEKPLGEQAVVRVEANIPLGLPSLKVFNAKTGELVSLGQPGYMLNEPGLYVVLLELTESIYWWRLGFSYTVEVNVYLEAPIFESFAREALANITRLQLALLGLSSRLSSLEGRVSSLEARVGSIEARVAELESRVSGL